MEKMSRAERARQFMPFSALRGFDELVQQQTVRPEPRRELSEQEAARLSARISKLAVGELITVSHYENGGYHTLQGMVSDIDIANRTLTVVRKKLNLDDIWRVSIQAAPAEG